MLFEVDLLNSKMVDLVIPQPMEWKQEEWILKHQVDSDNWRSPHRPPANIPNAFGRTQLNMVLQRKKLRSDVDLHRMDWPEALEHFLYFGLVLCTMKDKRPLQVQTGWGKHSKDGQATLKPNLVNFLQRNKVEFRPVPFDHGSYYIDMESFHDKFFIHYIRV